MSLSRCQRLLAHRKLVQRRQSSTALAEEDEYTKAPKYPPILDLSRPKKKERERQSMHETIRSVKTVEEKQIKINNPGYFGFKCYMFDDEFVPYNNLKMVQHITRTHLSLNDTLPSNFQEFNVDDFATDIKSDVEEAILTEVEGQQRMYMCKNEELSKDAAENVISSAICKQLNRLIINRLSRNYPHLVDAQLDIEPRIEASWMAGGMNPTERVKSSRRGLDWLKHTENDPIDRALVYLGHPVLTLRSELPLKPIISISEAENSDYKVPFWQYDPRAVGRSTAYRHLTNIPGVWPGDGSQFGILSYNKRGHMLKRNFNDPNDDIEALHSHGILASFGWLSAQANNLGFTTFNDITYPLVTQTVITNGKLWSFYVYQMNTMALHSDNTIVNPKRNICWATPEVKLYESIENGKVVGFNEEVLKMLLKFYSNVPESRLGVNLRPFLSNEEKVVADYTDNEKAEWLEGIYKHLMANRPRHQLVYEIYAWEKIYKIDHKTRFMDKRLRPFELGINPYAKTLDSKPPRYIPRAERPDLPRHKGRFARTFYP